MTIVQAKLREQLVVLPVISPLSGGLSYPHRSVSLCLYCLCYIGAASQPQLEPSALSLFQFNHADVFCSPAGFLTIN